LLLNFILFFRTFTEELDEFIKEIEIGSENKNKRLRV
jgi:hypothetical protein